MPFVVLAMGELVGFTPLASRVRSLIECATPVVVPIGAPLFRRRWDSLRHHNVNMFTLIAIGARTAYAYSLIATLVPSMIRTAMRDHSGAVPVHFERPR